jgi:hypothetical protein
MKKGLAAIAILVLMSVPVVSGINITEVMYDLPGSDKGLEWVVVCNPDNISVNLTGWRLYEQESKHRLKLVQGNMTIPANGYVVIVDKPAIWLEAHPEYKGTVIDSAFSLKNTGEYIAIMNDTHDIVCNVSYTPELGANGNGFTLLLNGSSNQLYECSVEGGTPGEGVINETYQSEVVTSATVDITASSPIPLYFAAGGDAPKRIPHRVSAGILGEASQLLMGTEEADILAYYHVDFLEEKVYETVSNGYNITAMWNLGNETVHFDVTIPSNATDESP